MDPLSVTASIIAILKLSSEVFGHLNDVKNAPRDLEQYTVEASNLFGLLVKLRYRLEEERSDNSWHNAVQNLGVKNGPLDQFKQVLEQLQTRITGRGRLKNIGDKLMWKFSKEEINSMLARMERLKTLVQVALEMDHLKLSEKIKKSTDITLSNTEVVKDDTGFIRAHIPTIESGLDAISQEADRVLHKTLMEWISSTDFPAQQSDFIARREKGTGQWFLDAPEFIAWLYGPNKTLFCPGIPGAGKTMITAIAINHLLNRVVSSSAVGVAYVYCNYKAQVDQNATGLLAAILKQLVQARPSIAEPVNRLHKQHADRGTKPTLEEIFGALQSVLVYYSSVYIAVDALDECLDQDGDRSQFLAKLQDLQSRTNLRLMVTSRSIPDITDKFSKGPTLEVRASDEDIKQFVVGQTYRLPKCIRRDNALQSLVQVKIVKAVDGMFLLAQLYVDSLLDKRTKFIVQSTLEMLSKGSEALDKAYADAIERIKGQLPQDSMLATNVLSWIIHAQRPLTTDEIRHALAVKQDDKELDQNNILDVEDIMSVCAGLVTIDKESNIIRLVHYTTQKYFEQVRENWNPQAQLMIASTCLTYLSFSIFKSGSCHREDIKSRLMQNPFLKYAASNWGLHTLTVQEEVCDLACSFLQQRSLVSCAMQAMAINSWFSDWQVNGLHLTAQFGLVCLTKELLSKSEKDIPISVNFEDKYGQTPLLLAVKYGHNAMVKLLLDMGAEVNAQGDSYGNALQTASFGGHEQIVKLLLDNGAEINVQSELHGSALYGSALYAASARSQEQIVKLLLDNGAEINAQGGRFGNALQVASAGGHEQIVKLLLDKGAKINAQGEQDGEALQKAAFFGHEPIVKLLLENGAEINAEDGHYGNALQTASAEGHKQIVKLLLDKGAEIDVIGGPYGSALRAASIFGHEQIVTLLLDNGAETNGGIFSITLQSASKRGYEQIVKLLLDRRAEICRELGNELPGYLDIEPPEL